MLCYLKYNILLLAKTLFQWAVDVCVDFPHGGSVQERSRHTARAMGEEEERRTQCTARSDKGCVSPVFTINSQFRGNL